MSEQLVPEIRVAGFDDEWINRPFGQLVHRRSSIVTSEGLPQVEYEDIESGFGRLNRDLRTKTSHKSGIAFEPGDVVFGKLRPYLKNWLRPEFEGLAVGDFWVLVPDTCTTSFLYALIQAPRFTEASSISSGSKMPRSDWPLVSQARFAAPQNHEEHELIGGTFHRLERLINDHRNKHRQLQQAKASLMQRMFPAVGASEPEIRFEGFAGEWAERKLTDEVDFFGGLTYSPRDVVAVPGVLVLRSSNVDASSIVLDDCVYVHPDAVNVDNVRPGDIVVVVRNGSRALIGKHAIVKRSMPSTVIGAFMTGIRCDRPEFISALLSTSLFESEVSKSMGATINQITGGMFAKMRFLFPEAEEQEAIGSFFSKLDDLIEAESQYVSKLQRVKSALLQKMFV